MLSSRQQQMEEREQVRQSAMRQASSQRQAKSVRIQESSSTAETEASRKQVSSRKIEDDILKKMSDIQFNEFRDRGDWLHVVECEPMARMNL